MPRPSTFSIAAFDPNVKAWGVAVASKFPAVGAVVPWVRAGSGAVATQSYANTSYGPRGLELMDSGMTAEQALERLLAEDEGRAQRQVGLIDMYGGAATFTGDSCHSWAGGRTGHHYAVQGNILTGERVIDAMAGEFESAGGNLPQRLLTALHAGDRAGGDRRGRQSAAIYVAREAAGYGGMNDRWIDYRVDDDLDPVPRLMELLQLHELYFGESEESQRLPIQGEVHDRLKAIVIAHAYLSAEAADDESAFIAVLDSFFGNENFEERSDAAAGWIDEPVYTYLLKKFES
ncbi:MAG: DUF1028 domain-containing protein [Anaerolineales bacterium]